MPEDYCVYLYNEMNSMVGSLTPSSFSSLAENSGPFMSFIILAALIVLFASFFGAQRSSQSKVAEKGRNQVRNSAGFGFRKDFEDWKDDDDANSGSP